MNKAALLSLNNAPTWFDCTARCSAPPLPPPTHTNSKLAMKPLNSIEIEPYDISRVDKINGRGQFFCMFSAFRPCLLSGLFFQQQSALIKHCAEQSRMQNIDHAH